MKQIAPVSTNEYIAAFPKNVQALLKEMRKTIRTAAPKAEELISYQMPAYKYYGMLVYFAGFKNHISFFPTSSGIAAFKKELSGYAGSKGTVRFPLDQTLPLKLISRIVKYRLKENEAKAKAKQNAGPAAPKKK
ncbi:MAG: DUF1801 domain-containing protein [Sphingobacteriales bacterium]|nr:DUF1801 domain-containing protein [Sphingobacteriales bacterium]